MDLFFFFFMWKCWRLQQSVCKASICRVHCACPDDRSAGVNMFENAERGRSKCSYSRDMNVLEDLYREEEGENFAATFYHVHLCVYMYTQVHFEASMQGTNRLFCIKARQYKQRQSRVTLKEGDKMLLWSAELKQTSERKITCLLRANANFYVVPKY